ncbi:MAG: metallophosphoesterase family protein [Desulfoprunum sp.]|nr:metallophosphoesterase family protein [Desulfoprunum sp.]
MTLSEQKIFAIGDIHGCHDKLITLLDRIPIDKSTDTLVFMGDYINRGPDSRKVLDTLLEIKATYNHVVFLMGNHEQALLEYAETGDVEILPMLRTMGVEATLTSYGASTRQLRDLACLPPEHREFLHALEFSYVAGGYLFTHADIDEEKLALAKARPDALQAQRSIEAGLLASRRLGLESIADTGYTVVFGHLPFEAPLVMADRIGIDTGAVYGNVLTAVELPAIQFYHA